MAESIVNYSVPVINLSLKQYDLLIESTTKANALLQVAMAADLEEIGSNGILYNFLWALHDLVYQVVELCDGLGSQQAIAKEKNHG